jgi:hypothetical protein
MEGSVTIESNWMVGKHREVGKEANRCRFLMDGDRYDLTYDQFPVVDGQKMSAVLARQIWDGESFLARTEMKAPGLKLEASRGRQSLRDQVNSYPGYGVFLLGYIQGDHVTDILSKAKSSKISDGDVLIDGAACVLVEGEGETGAFSLWIDKESGLMRKALLSKKKGDRLFQARLPEESVAATKDASGKESFIKVVMEKSTTTIDQVRIKKEGGTWIPVGGRQTNSSEYRAGEKHTGTVVVDFQVALKAPSFVEGGAFAMDGVPEGTRVHTMEKGDPRPYRWSNGKVVMEEGEEARPVNERGVGG